MPSCIQNFTECSSQINCSDFELDNDCIFYSKENGLFLYLAKCAILANPRK